MSLLLAVPVADTLKRGDAAGRVVAQVSPERRADTALRFYFERENWIQPPQRRAISRAMCGGRSAGRRCR